jgi:nickel transport protein
VIIVNSGDGHAAEASLPLERFAARATPQAQPESEPVVQGEAGAPLLIDTGSALRPADLSLIERKVEAAVARQIGPLLEAYTLAEGRVRFNDVMGGIGMITGLAGIALWASSRRRRDGGQS